MRLGYENLKPLPIGVKVVLLFMVGGRKGEGGGGGGRHQDATLKCPSPELVISS